MIVSCPSRLSTLLGSRRDSQSDLFSIRAILNWSDLGSPSFAIFQHQENRETRLSYNCAHLRLTKESLTIEYFEKAILLDFLGEN